MKIDGLFFVTICLLFLCCEAETENLPKHKKYKIQPTKIQPLSFYINKAGDTIDISQAIKVGAKFDNNYSLPLATLPSDKEEIIPFQDNITKAKPPLILPFETSMFDTLINGDTLKLEVRPMPKGEVMEMDRLSFKRLSPPIMERKPKYAINTLSTFQGLPPTYQTGMLKDSDGFIWFASDFGITRFDGQSINVVNRNTGISPMETTTFFQDSKQNIWIGMSNHLVTSDHIICYNGKDFIRYTVKGGIGNIAHEDQEGMLWGTGLNCLFYMRDTSFVYFPTKANENVKFLLEDTNEDIWLEIENINNRERKKIVKYDGHNFLQLKENIHDITNMRAMTIDRQSSIWMLGTKEGQSVLMKFDGEKFYTYSNQQGFNLKIEPLQGRIEFDSRDNVLVIGQEIGMTVFDGNTFTHLGNKDGIPNQIGSLMGDEEDNLWLFSWRYNGVYAFTFTEHRSKRYDQKLYHYHPNKFDYINHEMLDSISDWRQNGIFIFGHQPPKMDANGALWWQTSRSNWSRLRENNLYQFQMPVHAKWSQMIDSDGGMWSYSNTDFLPANEKKGADEVYRYQNNRIATLPTLGELNEILEDRENKIWMKTKNNFIHSLDEDGLSTFSFDGDFITDHRTDMIVNSKNQLWLASEEGKHIARFDGEYLSYFKMPIENKSFPEFGIFSKKPIEDDKGNMWFLVEDYMLVKYDGNNFWSYDFSTQLKGSINSLIKDNKDRIWLSTQKDGIVRFDGTYFTFLNTNDGLLSNTTNSMYKDFADRIWVSTINGLCIFEEAENGANEEYNIYTFNDKDGWNSDICLFGCDIDFSEKENKAFISSQNGVGFFNLEKLKPSTKTPQKLELAQLDINQQFIDYNRLLQDTIYQATLPLGNLIHKSFIEVPRFLNYPINLSLPYYIDNLTFHFISQNWDAPHKTRYSFKLEGVDRSWTSPQASPSIDYRNLPHGKHKLLARAKNEANIWSSPIEYRFRIYPPWWLSWWAYTFYSLLFLAGLYGGFLLLKRRLDLQNAYKQKLLEAERLKELDNFKSTFYTNITHEFRTPLTVILGMAQQIEEKPKQYLQEGIGLIKRNGKNLLQQINQILDLSKLENNVLKINKVQGDVVEFLRYSTEAFQSFANSKNLSLRFFSPVESLQMDYDPDSLQNVMSNLLSNALKFTPEGGDVKTALAIENDQLFIKVIDTGVGIQGKDLSKIFDRFYQAKNKATKNYYGTGVGLAYTKALVQLMNGTIEVESTFGKGTAFIVKLPIVLSDTLKMKDEEWNASQLSKTTSTNKAQLPSAEKDSILKTQVLNPQNSKFPQLLLIEDNADVVTYLKSCLQDQYQIQVAYNGRIGIEKAIEHTPDLIISDVMMPEKDGYEVCDTLKQDERTSHIPIILLTAKADLPSKIVGLRRGADAYLAKPFDKEELLVRLEMMVKKQQKMATYFSGNGESRVEIGTLEEAVKVEHEFIQKIRKIVEQHYANDQFGLPQLCQKAGMSRSQLYRKMKALIDTSPSDFIRTYRLQQAKHLLETTDLNVSEAAWDTGFTNLTHFAKVFQEEFGVLPSKLKSDT